MIEIFYYQNGVKKAGIEDLEKIKSNPLWVDCTNLTNEESEVLRKTFELHPLTAEDLINTPIRIKVEEFNNYLFCAFYAIHKAKTFELIEMDFVLGNKFIISNHKKDISSFNGLKKSNEIMEKLFNKGIDFIFHKLLDMEIDNYFPHLEQVEDNIESLENKVAKKPRPELLSRILNLKRQIVQMRRSSFEQREKISLLAKNENKFISKKAVPYFRDIYDHSIRVSDTLDNHREAIGNAFDVYMSVLSNSMNEVMKVLSIIATIALPLTVISGIYGTNFTVLPGSSFVFGFWAMILFMILLSVGMIYFFRRRHWF